MSGKSKYRTASDSLPARVSGPWAQDKLEALDGYIRIVNKAVAKKWRRLCYVDLMAGCGRCVLANGREFDGDFYAQQLMKLGYRYRTQLNRAMSNTRNAPLYRVMLFSKHPLAKKLFDVVVDEDRTRSPPMEEG